MIKCISVVSYELDLLANTKIYPVFHVSLLKPAPTTLVETNPLPQEPTTIPLEPEELLDVDVRQLRGGKKIVHYSVKWKGVDANKSTWETKDMLEGYPHLATQIDYIEDNVYFKDGESYVKSLFGEKDK